jgi:hypothetical protein
VKTWTNEDYERAKELLDGRKLTDREPMECVGLTHDVMHPVRAVIRENGFPFCKLCGRQYVNTNALYARAINHACRVVVDVEEHGRVVAQ